jgi:hypothetical protein
MMVELELEEDLVELDLWSGTYLVVLCLFGGGDIWTGSLSLSDLGFARSYRKW